MNENNQFNKENYNHANFVIALIFTVISAVLFCLTFSPLGVYSLIGATLFSLIGLHFITKHKKICNDCKSKVVNVCTHAVFAICLITFIVGIIVASINGN